MAFRVIKMNKLSFDLTLIFFHNLINHANPQLLNLVSAVVQKGEGERVLSDFHLLCPVFTVGLTD